MAEIACPHCGGLFDPGDEQRSDAEHRLYFSCVKLAFDMLPESEHGRWATTEDLRAWALVRTGWHTQEIYLAASRAEAERIATWQRNPRCFPIIDKQDPKRVTLYRPRSQRHGEMGKTDFRKSSEAVLLELSKLIGVDVITLRKEGLSYSIPA